MEKHTRLTITITATLHKVAILKNTEEANVVKMSEELLLLITVNQDRDQAHLSVPLRQITHHIVRESGG